MRCISIGDKSRIAFRWTWLHDPPIQKLEMLNAEVQLWINGACHGSPQEALNAARCIHDLDLFMDGAGGRALSSFAGKSADLIASTVGALEHDPRYSAEWLFLQRGFLLSELFNYAIRDVHVIWFDDAVLGAERAIVLARHPGQSSRLIDSLELPCGHVMPLLRELRRAMKTRVHMNVLAEINEIWGRSR